MKDMKQKVEGVIFGTDLDTINENSNKDGKVIPVQRDLLAGVLSKEYGLNHMLPKNVSEAHKSGLIHFHDLDYSPLFPMFNCMLIDIEGMFKNGFKIGNTELEEPKSFGVACQVTAQVIAQVSSHIYGGNTINGIDRILAPYVKMSFRKHFIKAFGWITGEDMNVNVFENEYGEIEHDNDQLRLTFTRVWQIAEDLTVKEVNDGIQATTFGIVSDLSWEGREIQKAIFNNRIRGIGKGGRTAIFPKLVYALEEGNNVNPTDPNYDIKVLAMKCSAKRLYPDIVSKPLIEKVTGDFKFPMGCRSFLGTYENEEGQKVTDGRMNLGVVSDGRMNLGVVSLNLPRIAIQSKGNEATFYKLLDEALEIAYEGLMFRINRFDGVTSDVA